MFLAFANASFPYAAAAAAIAAGGFWGSWSAVQHLRRQEQRGPGALIGLAGLIVLGLIIGMAALFLGLWFLDLSDNLGV